MRIFISYNNANLDIVQTLAADVAALSHHAWFDKELTGGQAWWDRILAEIRGCDLFLFALSCESLESYPCKLEHDYACRLGKPVLPVLVGEGVSPGLLPPALSTVQFVDYRRHDKPALFAVMKALDSLAAPQPPDVAPEPPPVPISYLGELKDQIDSVPSLTFEAQTVLVFKLKEALRQQADARDGRRLLETLRKRRDLFAVVAAEIDEALAERPARSAAERRAERAQAQTGEAATLPVLATPKPAPPKPAPPVQAAPSPPAPAAVAAAQPPAADPSDDDDAQERQIKVASGVDSVVDVLRRVVKTHEVWTFVATPYRNVAVQCDGQTVTAIATFSDLAELVSSPGNKLKTSGWEKDFFRTAGQMLAGVAVGLSFGALLLNRTVRDSSVANSMSRSWPLRNGETRHLRTIATEILNALTLIAPNHKTVTARRQQG